MAILVTILSVLQACSQPIVSQTPRTGVQRLYILNCGEGVAGDISRWSPGVNVGQSMPFAGSCYLIRHAQGWMLWDTGLADSVAAMPQGLQPSDPRAITWHLPKTLAAQLGELGVKPSDIQYVAVSHSHPDHIGNVDMFPDSMLLVQKAEYESTSASSLRSRPSGTVTTLQGDRDVFGDGSVVIISTPGHTVGHQSLLVKLPRTGAVLLSGDAVHFKSNWDNKRVPSINFNAEQTAASMQLLANIIASDKAQLWINHDKAQRDEQKLSPAFYE
ncbi:N-acyl homoserine lactonase family protein [Variovorax ureilyticus]|uniref:N-acyl homoserine lactonase family protein n=1 Tax=Variovorax ureilyticus TaxID=1836198 RepID=A0ABU8VH98_9BURK